MFEQFKKKLPLIVLIVFVSFLATMILIQKNRINQLTEIIELQSDESQTEEFSMVDQGNDIFTEDLVSRESFLVFEGTSNQVTDKFFIEKLAIFSFHAMNNNLINPNETASFSISLFKEGIEEPVDIFKSIITHNDLVIAGWTPEVRINDIEGVINGISWPSFLGPGEFYFQIEVENIDRWILEVKGE